MRTWVSSCAKTRSSRLRPEDMTDKALSVLVVTDDTHLRDEVLFGFPEDAQVEIVADSRAAMEMMSHMVPSVLVAQIRTGSAGGFGLLREMRHRALLGKIPVLMLLEREQDRWLAQQAGATVALVEPVDASELVATAIELASASAVA